MKAAKPLEGDSNACVQEPLCSNAEGAETDVTLTLPKERSVFVFFEAAANTERYS